MVLQLYDHILTDIFCLEVGGRRCLCKCVNLGVLFRDSWQKYGRYCIACDGLYICPLYLFIIMNSCLGLR